MPKPSEKPEWASGGSAEISTPPTPNKGQGWTNSKPPHQWFNWLAFWTWTWINYFESTTDTNITNIASNATAIAANATEITAHEGSHVVHGATGAVVGTGNDQTFLGVNEFDKQVMLKQLDPTTVGTPGTGLSAVYVDQVDGKLKRKTASAIRLMDAFAHFDAVVGSADYCTHTDLASAIAAVSAGASILVISSLTLNSTVTVNKNDIEISLKPGVVLSKGTATTGILISNSGCRLRGGKVSGFGAGGDKAISIGSGGTSAMLRDIRFTGNTTDVDDANDLASVLGCVNE